jgi:hypothetical protein
MPDIHQLNRSLIPEEDMILPIHTYHPKARVDLIIIDNHSQRQTSAFLISLFVILLQMQQKHL